MKLVWLNDIHLNLLSRNVATAFIEAVGDAEPDAVLIGGDIAESHDLVDHLRTFETAIGKPIYFVLGSHDYYGSSISDVRSMLKNVTSPSNDLVWLENEGVIRLSEKTALIGHGSWPDGRFGDYDGSDIMISDFFCIQEFIDRTREERLSLMQTLAQEAVEHFEKTLPNALEVAENIILITHVPPFREACLYENKISDDAHLPFFSSKVVGDVLLDVMQSATDKKLTALCGHTHGRGEIQMLPNLRVLLGGARYGDPKIQKIFEFE
ncbi:MAG: metallophosphoesterase [Candidatus Zixiibacteriota bacterium]|nr:MAG: metallophosphoesterase [candidate division Zixibacteria bacterium]